MGILHQAASGIPVASLCRAHGMSSVSFYQWLVKYGGMDVTIAGQQLVNGAAFEKPSMMKITA